MTKQSSICQNYNLPLFLVSPSFPFIPPSLSFSPPLSTSCSAEISAEAPVRLSGDRDGGSDITSPLTDCQPSAVAMATSATACGAEAGDETPLEGGEEPAECVRTALLSFCLLPRLCSLLFAGAACRDASLAFKDD